ncbi:MAG TPA: NAD(+) synthase [Dehalococcoidales bacterium]|nr:NAD(+) synthase [Dehalococcoidales bacterium]
MEKAVFLNKDLHFLRIAAVVPEMKVADVDFNTKGILKSLEKASAAGVQIAAFPEMSLTGYRIDDLVQHQVLLEKAMGGLRILAAETQKLNMALIVGLPVAIENKVYNCAAVVSRGKICGLVPKTYLPNYKEFYDSRWFESGSSLESTELLINGETVPCGTDLLFAVKGFPEAVFGIEICEDLWVPLAPHAYQSLAGACILFNLSASNEVLGKDDWRRVMVSSASGRCQAAYCYVSSSIAESSNDIVFGGHSLIAENGTILNETPRLRRESNMIICDIDVERLVFDRQINATMRSNSYGIPSFRKVAIEIEDVPAGEIQRQLDPHPFVPGNIADRASRCREIFSMQIGALSQKLRGAKKQNIVLGVSGGLDSTLALLAAVKTIDFLNLPRTCVHAFTLPGFGTTQRTKMNATRLGQALGVSFQEVDITGTCLSQFKDLSHKGQEDVVYENVQARYRTAFLFNKANELDAIVLGTGDLTEVALGWSTFAGDQLSHYHINVSVPKTLVQYLIGWVAEEEMKNSPAQKVLYDILETPISPELLKPANGQIQQKSEDIIGPVELADFFLYPFIRFGMRPGKILFLADTVNRRGLFCGKYEMDDLHKWLRSFIRRFFANQFKRTCMPEGPKVGSVSLSPRGDWRMPSDAEPTLWLEDLEAMYTRLKP